MVVLLIVTGVVVISLLEWGAAALRQFSRHDIETFCERNNRLDRLDDILKHHTRAADGLRLMQAFLVAAIFVGLVWEVVPQSESQCGLLWHWLVVGLALAAVLIVGPLWLVPPLARLSSAWVVYHGWWLWRLVSMLCTPLLLVGTFIAAVIYRLAGIPEVVSDEEAFEEEIRTIVTEGHREGHIEEDAREMIEGVIELGDATVSEIMTPRTDMKSIPASLSWDEMLAEVVASAHTRIPVYRENRDEIFGVLIVKDLLVELAKHATTERRAWTELLKEPIYVPETKPVNQLLQDFLHSGEAPPPHQRPHSHLAIVLDEYGGVSGLVTLEDILEEIVGEIIDEHDPLVSAVEIAALEDGVFDILGRTHIDEINEQLHIALPEDEDYDTIAGYIFSTLGRIPKVGESLEIVSDDERFVVTISEATSRRIDRVIIRKAELS